MTQPNHGQPPVTFTIDGVAYTAVDRRQTAAELLELAGMNSEDHDLALVRGSSGIDHRFADSDEVQITPGARYVSIFTGPTPVA